MEGLPHYTSHNGRLLSLWVAEFLILALWAIALLTLFANAFYKSVSPSRPTYAQAAHHALEREGGGDATTADGRGEAGALVEEPMALGSEWLSRLDRASESARTSSVLLLFLATIASMPIEYTCRKIGRTVLDSALERGPGSIPVDCTTCFTNVAGVTYVGLAWAFFAAAVVWFLLEIMAPNAQSAAGHRLLVTLLGQPLVAIAGILALIKWHRLKSSECGI